MGIADIIPGISGGTVAFILGIYEELIDAIKSFDWRFVRLLCRLRTGEAFSAVAWQFLGPVLLGIAGAIFSLSGVISWLMANDPVMIYSFFFGLILATAPMIARIIEKWTVSKCFSAVLAVMGTYYFVGMIPVATPESLWFVFVCGAIAISAMILPGISGAFILVVLGKYQFILDALHQRDFLVVGVFLLGVTVGILSFVRILSWLFGRYHDLTIAILTGVVLGSLRKVWPWKETVRSILTSHGKLIPVEEINRLPPKLNGEVLLAVAMMAAGFAIAMALNRAPRKNLLPGQSLH